MWFLVDSISGQPYFGQKEQPVDINTPIEYEFGLLYWTEENYDNCQSENSNDSQQHSRTV